jgi:hypothetical protein
LQAKKAIKNELNECRDKNERGRLQAVPKLRDQSKPFIRGQAGDFVMSELHWVKLAEPTASVDPVKS